MRLFWYFKYSQVTFSKMYLIYIFAKTFFLIF